MTYERLDWRNGSYTVAEFLDDVGASVERDVATQVRMTEYDQHGDKVTERVKQRHAPEPVAA